MKKKKINPVLAGVAVLIIALFALLAISGNQASDGESAMDELEKDSATLLVADKEENKIGNYQKGYEDSKRPKNVEHVTPEFRIEESNLADNKKNEEPEKEKTKSSGGQVEGSYSSPYQNNNGNNTTTREPEKSKPAPKEDEDDNAFNISTRQNTGGSGGKFKGVIHGDQKLRDGSSVKIRLQEDATVKGKTVPRNTIFYGTLSASGNGRLQITITQFSNVASGSANVLDTDYQPGIKYDQAVESGVATESKSIGRQITSDILNKLPYGRYASSLVRSARGADGSIYLIDGYKIIIQVN